jgi:hypothetical protein
MNLCLDECIRIMKVEVEDEYAQHYLNAIEEAIDEGGTEGLGIQLLYVLENCKQWKGPVAREVKAFIRNWIKENNAEH